MTVDSIAISPAAISPRAAISAPVEVGEPETVDVVVPDRPWKVIVWNDPINLMSYVTLVLRKLFGYSQEKAHKLMLDVHLKGKAVVSSGNREKAELDVFRLHEHGLWATMEQDE
ncbi:MAG: ATP-dependent Clp protease adapter ClpS [Acidimicrobiaceae bacterium]|nr:ATP-dependent Clp protease adapter ClpS [Acidimicrobiaceae bacterium]